MKQFRFLSMMLAVMILPFMAACSSSDDDDPVLLESYIIGTWHTYKASGYGNSQSVEIDITKTGEYSAAYEEVVFEKGNKVTIKSWVLDKNGITHWTETPCTYTVKGDIVTITDPNGESGDLVFDAKEKTLLLKSTIVNSYGIQIFMNIYFRKN